MIRIALLFLVTLVLAAAPFKPAPVDPAPAPLRRAPLPRQAPPLTPRGPGGPYECMVGIIFVDGAPVLTLICDGVPMAEVQQ